MKDTKDRIVEALNRIVQLNQNVTDLPILLEMIMQESQRLLDTEASSLFLHDEERNDLYFGVVVGGMNASESSMIRVPMGRGIVGAAATERKTQLVTDCASDPRHFQKVDSETGFVTRNLIATPMIRNNRLIGVLEVLNLVGDGTFDEMDAKLLEIMAEHAAAAIENARLIQANVRAERLAALGTASAKISHYIKNVLTQWEGSASLIDMGIETNNSALITQAWPIMKRAKGKISDLVRNMLTVSKEREPELSDVDLNKMIGEIVGDSTQRAAKAGVLLATQLAKDLPIAQLDASQMQDLILNLVGNAIEALEEAGAGDPKVTVTTQFDPKAKIITLTVADNGPGMPPEVKAKVFEPFFSTKKSKGTGLGLAMVKKTIDEHKGKLRLDSEVDQGTTFTIELPCASD